jgi:hypothetical protein
MKKEWHTATKPFKKYKAQCLSNHIDTSTSCAFYCSDSAAPCAACPAGGARHHHRHGGGSLPCGFRLGAAQPRLQPGRAPAPPQGEYGEPGGRLSRPSGGSGGPGLPYGENRRPGPSCMKQDLLKKTRLLLHRRPLIINLFTWREILRERDGGGDNYRPVC